jgi:PEP-utilising enzyme, mobile domain/Pyruvate phosphate dikinase, AMP/ATP-binding domain
LLDLDAGPAIDPSRFGSKASALAAARGLGLPVLPGFAVGGSLSRSAMELGAGLLASRGSGGARLAISAMTTDLDEQLVESAGALGDTVVARSSTVLEGTGEWSGAFTSYLDLQPSELPRAVVGCWASAFTVSSLERQAAAGVKPGSFDMPVLVQQAVAPQTGGQASISPDGSVSVTGMRGHPAPLLQGWAPGQVATHDGSWGGEELIDMLGIARLDEIAATLRTAALELGANTCEWAVADRLWLLQLGHSPTQPPRLDFPSIDEDLAVRLTRIARLVTRFPGRLGEEMVIPWALTLFKPLSDEPKPTEEGLSSALLLRDELVSEVWGTGAQEAMRRAAIVIGQLRGSDPARAMRRLESMPAPNPAKAALLIGLLTGLQSQIADLGIGIEPDLFWTLGTDQIQAIRDGRPPRIPDRSGVGRWDPLVTAVVLTAGVKTKGTPASPGVGSGRLLRITNPHHGGARRRRVLTAQEAIPNLAPLLWDAAALVTATGSPAAHLFESARAVRVPAVCGVDLRDSEDDIVAVDGDRGLIATLRVEGQGM